MAALGNTEDAQRQLSRLNDSAAADTPGANTEHPWESFEDFQESVCQADWYKPDGQMVVIDPSTGEFIAMSAITRMEGNLSAYNLFTGVDRRYRGRKLAQAVKVIALRYAREVLQAPSVQTNHNAQNDPMIAIDRKLGYIQTPGTYLMEKSLE
jgi:RimJ/RimL family protein N-acetyltransferase